MARWRVDCEADRLQNFDLVIVSESKPILNGDKIIIENTMVFVENAFFLSLKEDDQP